jgi:hypothetical protein
MSNQEMQFADPDWKPSQQLNPKNDQQEQEEYTPQPINNEYREQNKWGSAPPTISQQQEGYTGLRPYDVPVPGQMQGGMYRQRSYRRRGRGMWFWIVLAFIIFSLISGGSRFSRGFDSGFGSGFKQGPVDQGPVMGLTNKFIVNGTANIMITDPNGNITVTEDPSNTNAVVIQAVQDNGPIGNSTAYQPVINQQGNSITASVPDNQQGPVDLNITVPENSNVNLTAGGMIKFNGSFGTAGTNQFQTSDGDISITVPPSSLFHLDALTNSGSINSDFPNVKIQTNPSGSGQNIKGMVGGNSQSQAPIVIIKSDSGNITLNTK